jgi:DNA modification methylase
MIEVNKIYNDDCLNILKQLPDKCIDLVLTDPPYGIGISNNPVRQKHIKKDWDNFIPISKIFNEIFRVSKNQIIWGGNYFELPPTQGFFVWNKVQPENFTLAMCEFAWYSKQQPAKMFTYSVLKEKDKIHPTQKPVQLFEWLLNRETNPNDLILDCFSGSGTTAIACHNLKRRFICIEKDYDYWKASCERLEEHQSQLRLF